MSAQAASSSHLYIVTGASRGLGLALAQQLLQPGHTVLTLANLTDRKSVV